MITYLFVSRNPSECAILAYHGLCGLNARRITTLQAQYLLPTSYLTGTYLLHFLRPGDFPVEVLIIRLNCTCIIDRIQNRTLDRQTKKISLQKIYSRNMPCKYLPIKNPNGVWKYYEKKSYGFVISSSLFLRNLPPETREYART